MKSTIFLLDTRDLFFAVLFLFVIGIIGIFVIIVLGIFVAPFPLIPGGGSASGSFSSCAFSSNFGCPRVSLET